MGRTSVEFQMTGDYALFSDPILRTNGQKFSYDVPTYEAVKGLLKHVYWSPSIIWVIDEIRIMNQIQRMAKGIRPLNYGKTLLGLAYYTYLVDVDYQVKAHFIFNQNRPEFKDDWIVEKHINIAKRAIKAGGRMPTFLGTSECVATVQPCKFGSGKGYYDNKGTKNLRLMMHGITYPDEAYPEIVPETKGNMCRRMSELIMKNGIIRYPRPQKCIHEVIRPAQMLKFENINK